MSIRLGSKIIASYNEPVPIASNSIPGKIKIATDSEVAAGTNNSAAVTPRQLANEIEEVRLVPDSTTILKTEQDITAIGTLSKNGVVMYDWIGTNEQYDQATASGIIQENWVCWITDDE